MFTHTRVDTPTCWRVNIAWKSAQLKNNRIAWHIDSPEPCFSSSLHVLVKAIVAVALQSRLPEGRRLWWVSRLSCRSNTWWGVTVHSCLHRMHWPTAPSNQCTLNISLVESIRNQVNIKSTSKLDLRNRLASFRRINFNHGSSFTYLNI